MRPRLLATAAALAVGLGSLTGLTLVTAAPAAAAAQVFPVPTSSAGLGRITTAPNGDMWFVEEEVNKIGRITPSGVISEFGLGATTTSESSVQDLDVAPDGTIWVTHDSGRRISQFSATGQPLKSGSLGDYPYGGDVRVDPAGTAWITMNFDESYVARVVGGQTITASANSPECDDVLGEAANGSMWCGKRGGIVQLNADASGGTTYPVGVFASYPRTLAAGPVGSIWFGMHESGTIGFSPSTGYVGYLNGATPVTFNTGERTAPADLVRGPDNAMWFTSIGAAKAIGHVDASGRGALTQVGNYSPTSLTFGPDGAVWFTDATNNVIVRVPTSELQTTNVDPGEGSVFTVGQGARTVPVKVAGGRKVTVRQGRVPLTLACPKGTKGGCKGKVQLVTVKPVKKPGAGKKATPKVAKLTAPTSFKLKAGKKLVVRPRLTRAGGRVVGRKPVAVQVLVGGVAVGTLKVRR